MRLPELVFSCVLSILSGRDVPKVCSSFAHEVAAAITGASRKYEIDAPVIAAVIYHESAFRARCRGARGEIGLMQIMRGGAVPRRLDRLSDQRLQSIALNINIGTRYLAHVARVCKGPPLYWLSRYNGRPCRPSRYSRGVLGDLNRASRSFATKYVEANEVPPYLDARTGQPTHVRASTATLPAIIPTRSLPGLRMGMPGLWFLRRRYQGRPHARPYVMLA
jgi:soluble lytic murein transglycosylase-like protein